MHLSETTRRFVRIIGKIPMFEGLNPTQAVEILKICKPRTLSNKEPVCLHSTSPTEMFVLLSGKLAVFAPEGTLLTHLSPITIHEIEAVDAESLLSIVSTLSVILPLTLSQLDSLFE